jgi:hypothetical protein
VILGELPIDDYVTHEFNGLDKVNESIDVLHAGKCLRAVIHINDIDNSTKSSIKLVSSNKFGNGSMKRYTHWSESN